jgi:hypothetical protein
MCQVGSSPLLCVQASAASIRHALALRCVNLLYRADIHALLRSTAGLIRNKTVSKELTSINGKFKVPVNLHIGNIGLAQVGAAWAILTSYSTRCDSPRDHLICCMLSQLHNGVGGHHQVPSTSHEELAVDVPRLPITSSHVLTPDTPTCLAIYHHALWTHQRQLNTNLTPF